MWLCRCRRWQIASTTRPSISCLWNTNQFQSAVVYYASLESGQVQIFCPGHRRPLLTGSEIGYDKLIRLLALNGINICPNRQGCCQAQGDYSEDCQTRPPALAAFEKTKTSELSSFVPVNRVVQNRNLRRFGDDFKHETITSGRSRFSESTAMLLLLAGVLVSTGSHQRRLPGTPRFSVAVGGDFLL
jgi:hypothetical protein